jgi:hypothetical protein
MERELFFGQQSCGDGRILSLAEDDLPLAACTSTDGLGLGGVDNLRTRDRFSLALVHSKL